MKNIHIILLNREINLSPRIENASWYKIAMVKQSLLFLVFTLFFLALFSPLVLLGLTYGFVSIIFAPIGKKKEVFKKSFKIFSRPIGKLIIFTTDFFLILTNSNIRERIVLLNGRIIEHEKRKRE